MTNYRKQSNHTVNSYKGLKTKESRVFWRLPVSPPSRKYCTAIITFPEGWRSTWTHRHTVTHRQPELGPYEDRGPSVLPRTQHGRWLSCSAQQGQTLQQWPQLMALLLSSSAEPRAHGPHRCVHQNRPSKPGTWWVSAEQGSCLVLEKGTKIDREKKSC